MWVGLLINFYVGVKRRPLLLKIILLILHVLLAIGTIAVVLLQSGRAAGLSGAIAGGAEAMFGKRKGLDAFFERLTTFIAVGFFLTSLLMAVFS